MIQSEISAWGSTQAYGINYFETDAEGAKLTTYRIIFALASLKQ